MTVQELIEMLSKVEDKSLQVSLHIEHGRSLSICDDFGFGCDGDSVYLSGDETDFN